MTEIHNPFSKVIRRLSVVVLIAPAVALLIDASVALGVAAGGVWNLASLWCLSRILEAWIGPTASTKRVVGWLLVKFFVLYLAIYFLISRAVVSLVGFSIGFTVVLIAASVFLMMRSRALTVSAGSKR